MFRTGEGSGGASLTFRHAFPVALTASSAVLPVDFNEKLFHRLVDYATVCPAGGWFSPSATEWKSARRFILTLAYTITLNIFLDTRTKALITKGAAIK